MTHLDLFSGIGGFAYAADQVFGDVEHVFCDNEPFAKAVLHKHWPESYIYDDIKEITADSYSARCQGKDILQQGRSGSRRSDQSPFLLTGGFPCQPFSAAGLRRGTADDRHLWPEMLRVIRLTEPEWIIAENVRGILTWNEGLVFEQVCADLEASGYEVQPLIIPAVAVDAPHRRDRVWFVAHSTSVRRGSGRIQNRPRKTAEWSKGQQETERFNLSDWGQDWTKVATEFCSVDDGLPIELDGLKLSKSQHRKEQLKAYGNAIVPQVAIEVMKAML